MIGSNVVPIDRNRLRDDVRVALSDPWRVCELLALLDGAKREQQGVMVCCPSHGEKNPSCSVTRGPDGTVRAKCFACDFSGDVFGLLAVARGLDLRRDFARILDEAAELAGIDPGERPASSGVRPVPPATGAAPRQAPPAPEDLGPLWESLPPIGADAWEYLRGRALDEAADWCRGLADLEEPRPAPTAQHEKDADGNRACGGAVRCSTCRWEFAASGYLVAVALRDVSGRVVAIQVRNVRAEKGGARDNRFLALGPTSAGVFGDPTRIASARNVVIAEGMTDSLAALAACKGARISVVLGIAGVNAGAALDSLALKGKRVILAADPDAAGDLLVDGRTEAQAVALTAEKGKPFRAVRGLAEKLRERGATPVRARPPEGSDLATMAAGGEDLVAFFRASLAAAAGFSNATTRLVGERAARLAIAPRILTFGVKFLDATLGGIFPNDLILLGGVSGQGKTELARITAQANADAGKRVHYFALEAEENEIERRAKYARLADRMLSQFGGSRYYDRLNYLDWSAGRIDDLTGPFEEEADREVAAAHRNLYTSYPKDDFGIDAFEKAFLQIAEETDLVILDHFHFLDFGENENRGAKAAMKRLRALNLATGKPILVVAHIRKAERGTKTKRLIPVLDDFHGSSDVMKISTKAVLLAPATDRENKAPHLWKTYLSAGKCRLEGSRARYAACVTFDARRRRYEDEFVLGTVTPGGEKFVELDESRWPPWARAALIEPDLPPAPPIGEGDAPPPADSRLPPEGDDAPPPTPPEEELPE